MRQLIEISTDAQVEALIPKEGIFGFWLKSDHWKPGLVGKIVRPSVKVIDQDLLLSLELEPLLTYEIIPLSALREGVSLQLATNLGQRVVAQAVITKAWLKPATRDSWKNTPIPESGREKLDYSSSFTPQEYERVKLGDVPFQMEDHWFAYFENDWLYWFRSWSGIGIFEVHIELVENIYRVTEAWANRSQDAAIAGAATLDGLLKGMCRQARMFD